MPISEEEFRNPSWIKFRERYPMSYDKQDKFNEINPRHNAQRYQGDVGRDGGWKYAGYNPNHQTTRTETFNIRTDDIQLKPY